MGEDRRLQSATVVEMWFIWRPKHLINRDRYLIGPKEQFILEEQTEIYMTSQKKNEVKKHVYNDRIVDRPDMVDDNDPYIRRKTEEARKALAELNIFPPECFLKPEDGQQE